MEKITKEKIAYYLSYGKNKDDFCITWDDIENSSIGKIWVSNEFSEASFIPVFNFYSHDHLMVHSLEVISKNKNECICLYEIKKYSREKEELEFYYKDSKEILFEF